MTLKDKINHSIAVIQKASQLAERATGKPLWLAFSGGKDSQALYHVAQMAGVQFEAHMNFTSVDPPEVIRFVRRNYPAVITHPPRISIYDMAIKKKLLPTRRFRWCCVEYKETAGAARVTLVGVRKAESAKRSKRTTFEKIHKNPNKRKQWNFDQFEDHQETMAQCMGGGKEKIVVSPILEWTDDDVWEFLNNIAKVPHCELYDKGHKRIGCIICPMSSHKQKQRDDLQSLHVKRKWIETMAKMPFDRAYELTPEERFEWWISDMSLNKFLAETKQQLKLNFNT